MNAIPIVDTVFQDLHDVLTAQPIEGFYGVKYVEPPNTADKTPVLGVWPSSQTFRAITAVGETDDRLTLHARYGDRVADETDTGRAHLSERVDKVAKVAEKVVARLSTYPADWPADENVRVSGLSVRYGMRRGLLWTVDATFDVKAVATDEGAV